METRSLYEVLRGASSEQLELAINWLERPWEPRRNRDLRALWHKARRDAAAQPELAAALEREILAMPARDLDHVARRLGFVGLAPNALAVIRLLGQRLAPAPVSAAVLLAPLAAAAGAASALLTALLAEAGQVRHDSRRRHRHGGR